MRRCVDNLVLLGKPYEETITENLRLRYKRDNIYTYIGPTLVSVNPFKNINNLYTPTKTNLYHRNKSYELPPHIYSVASDAFHNLVQMRQHQSIIISGESGSGKTESAKHIMNYLADVSGSSEKSNVKQQILQSVPILEAFGNAKTLTNNNSSRFGKYMEIYFNMSGEMVGGKITHSLLEKSRVVQTPEHERNFHIFYQIFTDPKLVEQFELSTPDKYSYLRKDTISVKNINDAKDFIATKEAMKMVGISDDDQDTVFRIVSGILNLGNISFEPDPSDSSGKLRVKDDIYVKVASKLLQCDMKFLEVCLTARTVTAGGRKSSYLTPLTLEQAISAKDALAKHLYDRLFGWLIATINKTILPKERKNLIRIGILDIYGFEAFETNSFEQLCINYVNEKLQHLFVHNTLKSEQELYTSEGLSWKPVPYNDNKDCVSLIDSKLGIFDLLDETCTLNGSDDAFLDKVQKTHRSHKYLGQKPVKTPEFIIKHYAGDVAYHVQSFVKKNSDHLYNDLIELMQTSQCALIRKFFPEIPSEDKSKRPPTCSQQFIKDVNQMMSRLFAARAHYVRCIKPNSDKLPNTFNVGEVKNQVRYLGLVENVKLYQSGFVASIPFDKFLSRYKMITRHTLLGRYTGEGGCYQILRKFVGDNSGAFVCGKSRVFIKKPELLTMLEEIRERTIPNLVAQIQRRWRRRMLKRTLKPLKETYDKVFIKTKKRRRSSINRVYCGDYLEMSFSNVVQSVMQKNGDEKVYFSQYVNKVNNKGKVQQRVFVVTDFSIYNFGVDANRPKFKKRLPIKDIDWIAMSPYTDGFFVIQYPKYVGYLLECDDKIELIMILMELYKKLTKKQLNIKFSQRFSFNITKKEPRTITFLEERCQKTVIKQAGKQITAWIRPEEAVKFKVVQETRRLF